MTFNPTVRSNTLHVDIGFPPKLGNLFREISVDFAKFRSNSINLCFGDFVDSKILEFRRFRGFEIWINFDYLNLS